MDRGYQETQPEASAFGRRVLHPSGVRVFSLIRLAALWEAFMVAVGSLRSNKLRTALTLVGIVVGVAAVIAVVTIIKGLDRTVANTFSSQGSTVFTNASVFDRFENQACALKKKNYEMGEP